MKTHFTDFDNSYFLFLIMPTVWLLTGFFSFSFCLLRATRCCSPRKCEFKLCVTFKCGCVILQPILTIRKKKSILWPIFTSCVKEELFCCKFFKFKINIFFPVCRMKDIGLAWRICSPGLLRLSRNHFQRLNLFVDGKMLRLNGWLT